MFYKHIKAILLLAFLLVIPCHAFAGTGLSGNCYSVKCDPGEDYYADACRPHIETIANCSPHTKFTCENGCYTPVGSTSTTNYCTASNEALKTDSTGKTICGIVDDGDWKVNGLNITSIPTGNVGIGTTNPLSKLSVGGEGKTTTAVFGQQPTYPKTWGALGYFNGTNYYGVYGTSTDFNYNFYGVYGEGNKAGVYARGMGAGDAIQGICDNGVAGCRGAVLSGGTADSLGLYVANGKVGIGTSVCSSGLCVGGNGVSGAAIHSSGSTYGGYLEGTYAGLAGRNSNNNNVIGMMGVTSWFGNFGVYGSTSGTSGYGGFFAGDTGIYSSGSTWAGYFSGKGYFSGSLQIGSGSNIPYIDGSPYTLNIHTSTNPNFAGTNLQLDYQNVMGLSPGELSIGGNNVSRFRKQVVVDNSSSGTSSDPYYMLNVRSADNTGGISSEVGSGYTALFTNGEIVAANNKWSSGGNGPRKSKGDQSKDGYGCHWSWEFSEENSGQGFCNQGEFVAGMNCDGSNCDDITLWCCPL